MSGSGEDDCLCCDGVPEIVLDGKENLSSEELSAFVLSQLDEETKTKKIGSEEFDLQHVAGSNRFRMVNTLFEAVTNKPLVRIISHGEFETLGDAIECLQAMIVQSGGVEYVAPSADDDVPVGENGKVN
jgi:hypothetical protein